MSALELIWTTAIALSGGSLTWLSALIGLRLIRDRRDAQLAEDRRAVMDAIVAILAGADATAAEKLRPYARRGRLMAEVILELHGLIRGADRERVFAVMRELGVARILQRRLVRGSAGGRLACLEALAALGGPEATRTLWEATRQADRDLRLLAFRALAANGAPVRVGVLLDEMAGANIRPSRLLSEVLRERVAADPAQALASLGRTDLPGVARALLIDALGAAGDYAALPALVAHAADADPEVRVAAVRALGRLQHPLAQPALAQGLTDESWPVRAAAAEAAGSAHLDALCEPLAALVSDPEWWVRFRAADALARLGRPGLAHLRDLAADGAPAAQLALAERNL